MTGQQFTSFYKKDLAKVYTYMQFKQWLEDTTTSSASFGNEEDPDEHGLKRQSFLNKPVPASEKASKLFGLKFMSKNSRKRPVSSHKPPLDQD